LATFGFAARSNEVLMSSAVTSRFTGGLNLNPLRTWTVTILASEEISGFPSAVTGVGSAAVFGLSMYSGDPTA
jgi:hypothetical protein